MKHKNILVISNMSLSDTESNGRVLSMLIEEKSPSSIHNYCLGGISDKKYVNYLVMNDFRNFKSLCTFGYIKPETNPEHNNTESVEVNVKKKKAIHYFARNVMYMLNCSIRRYLRRYIFINNINEIFLFGTDAPYMYRLARVLSKKCNIPLEIYTCEDYPLKDYNYIENGHDSNIFFRFLIRSLRKQTKKAYAVASISTFNSRLLCNDYKNIFCFKNSNVRYLPSVLDRVAYATRKIRHIVYGGNLYSDRVNSLLDVAKALLDINKDVVLEIYGRASKEDEARLVEIPNIQYHGTVEYSSMIEIYKNADMLLHVDGFSDYSIKDYRHAFSTKISDCYMLGIPFFIYAPMEIASTQYAFKMNDKYVATSKEDLASKLRAIIESHLPYSVDYEKIKSDFGLFINQKPSL